MKKISYKIINSFVWKIKGIINLTIKERNEILKVTLLILTYIKSLRN